MFTYSVFSFFFFFSSRRRHTRLQGDWSSDVCSSDLTTESAEQRAGRPSWISSCADRFDPFQQIFELFIGEIVEVGELVVDVAADGLLVGGLLLRGGSRRGGGLRPLLEQLLLDLRELVGIELVERNVFRCQQLLELVVALRRNPGRRPHRDRDDDDQRRRPREA